MRRYVKWTFWISLAVLVVAVVSLAITFFRCYQPADSVQPQKPTTIDIEPIPVQKIFESVVGSISEYFDPIPSAPSYNNPTLNIVDL